MKLLLLLLLPILASCLPQSPTDKPEPKVPAVFDPLASQAWHLENTGQHAFSESVSSVGEDHKIKAAHKLGLTGKDIRIAVSDDAVEVDHADLEQNQLVGEHRDYNISFPFLGSPAPITFDDAHGTGVTGLIAAVKGNTIGSYGVAPDALFAGFNFLSSDTQDPSIIFHQTQGNFNIFNYSYGSPGYLILDDYDPDLEEALLSGVSDGANYVKAAGNSFVDSFDGKAVWGNANFETEQTLPYYIVTGAINSQGRKSSYSTPGSNLWISGAGGEFGTEAPAMITTDLSGCSFGYAHAKHGLTMFDKGLDELNINCDFMNTMNGTSSATPIISGIIALMLEANPDLTWRDVKHILAKTADRVDYDEVHNTLTHPHSAKGLFGHTYDVKWTRNGAGNYFSNWYGFGRANALAASLMALQYTFPLGSYISGSLISSDPLDPESNSIPQSRNGLTNSITVTGSPVSKIESVQLEVTVNHPIIGNLGIELTSPSNTTSRLFLINSNGIDIEMVELPPYPDRTIKLLSNAFYEEPANGEWTVKIIDGSGAPEDLGTLENWSIKINGH